MSEQIVAQESNVLPSKHVTESLVAEEYKALRDEVIKRIEFRYQIINLVLVSAGTFLAAGLQPGISPSVLLIYPILAAFLTAGWVQNGMVLSRIGQYIREKLETQNYGLGWEKYFRGVSKADEGKTPRKRSYGRWMLFIFAGGTLLTTQLLAVSLGMLRYTASSTEQLLLVADGIAFLFTVIVLVFWWTRK